MANVLIVHDDSVISRTAYLLEERKRSIRLYESILRGESRNPEYERVDKDQIQHLLGIERDFLKDLIDSIRSWLFEQELRNICDEYVSVGKEATT